MKNGILAVVLAITFCVFSPSLGNKFTNWDDGALLTDNPDVHYSNPDNFKNIFSKTYVGTYIPLTLLSFKLEYTFFGNTPFFYYLDNLLLHMGVVALIFFLGLRLGLMPMAAGFAALLFGVHPMHVESVSWISQRKDVLYSVFYLGAVLQYWIFLETGNKNFFRWAIFLALCSILAKPMAYSLPLILLLCDWWKGRRLDWKLVVEKWPFLLLIGAVSLMTYNSNSHVTPLNVAQVLLVWIWVFIFHIQKFFWPYPLLTVYDFPKPIQFSQPDYLIAALLFVVIAVLLFTLRRRRWFVLAVLFYAFSVALLVLSSIWDWGTNTRVADRFMYLPSLGICLALGAGYQYLTTKTQYTRFVQIVSALVLASLIFITSGQVYVWKDNISLWSHVLKFSPEKILAYQNRAAGYIEMGHYNLAMNDLNHALLMSPQSAILYFCRADLFEKQGQVENALIDFNRSLALNPDDANTYFRRGLVYHNLRQFDKALEDYTAAVAKKADLDRAFYNRGMIYDDMGKTDLALADYAQVIKINPWHSKAFNNRAVIYINQGDYERAKVDLIKAIRIDSHNSTAYDNLRLITNSKRE